MSKSGTETTEAGVGLVEQFKQDTAQRRHAAAERYRELLLRSDEARAGDAAALAECMTTLGRGEGELESDIQLVRCITAGAQAEEEYQALAAPLKEARTERQRVAAWADEQRAKLEAKVGERVAAAERSVVAVQAARQAAATIAGEGQQWRDAWECIVTGQGLAEIRAARRRPKPIPVRQTREEIIEARRHETVGLRVQPIDRTPDGMLQSVNASLVAAGHTPLSDGEIQQYGVRGWLRDADNRPRTVKAVEAQKDDAQVARAE